MYPSRRKRFRIASSCDNSACSILIATRFLLRCVAAYTAAIPYTQELIEMPLFLEDCADARSRAANALGPYLEFNRHRGECANLARAKQERSSPKRYLGKCPSFRPRYRPQQAATRLDECRILVREGKHGLGQA